MRICINTAKLTDSPYSGSDDYPFIFDQSQINDLIQDIKLSNPTCYLVSGYRGAGKSSFIKKVEHSIKNDKQIIFVYSSFAKYKSHAYLLRKLIRGLYQSLIKDENIETFKELKKIETDTKEPNDKKTSQLLERLYEKTFHEVTDSSNTTSVKDRESKTEVNLILFVFFSLIFLLSLSNLIYPWIGNNVIIGTIISLIVSSIGLLKEFLSIKTTWSERESIVNEFERKSLYDDEISDYHFTNLLEGLAKKKFKVVFVLDELDKVNPNEINNLINEMKPFLVSGLANFIVIAGQELFYKFKSSDSVDDAILSTLFSRIIHVPLLSVSEFSNIFNQLMTFENNSSQANPVLIQSFVDYLIFKSKRIPRKFINLIRQEMYWENGKAYLDINEDSKEYQVYSEIIKSIQKIDDEEIAVGFFDGTRDYLNMQLFIKAEIILGMGWKNYIFTKDDLVNKAGDNIKTEKA